mgnify:CR=1 FL=1
MIQKLSGSKLYFSPIILSLAYLLGFDPFGYQLLGLLSVSLLFYFALKNKTYIIMGVCGCGKSSVGDLLASNTEGAFIDADSFHPPKNVEKMSAGVPLNDQDRKKWLIAIGQAIKDDPIISKELGNLTMLFRFKAIYSDNPPSRPCPNPSAF